MYKKSPNATSTTNYIMSPVICVQQALCQYSYIFIDFHTPKCLNITAIPHLPTRHTMIFLLVLINSAMAVTEAGAISRSTREVINATDPSTLSLIWNVPHGHDLAIAWIMLIIAMGGTILSLIVTPEFLRKNLHYYVGIYFFLTSAFLLSLAQVILTTLLQ